MQLILFIGLEVHGQRAVPGYIPFGPILSIFLQLLVLSVDGLARCQSMFFLLEDVGLLIVIGRWGEPIGNGDFVDIAVIRFFVVRLARFLIIVVIAVIRSPTICIWIDMNSPLLVIRVTVSRALPIL